MMTYEWVKMLKRRERLNIVRYLKAGQRQGDLMEERDGNIVVAYGDY